jgi:hypothetical protein
MGNLAFPNAAAGIERIKVASGAVGKCMSMRAKML